MKAKWRYLFFIKNWDCLPMTDEGWSVRLRLSKNGRILNISQERISKYDRKLWMSWAGIRRYSAGHKYLTFFKVIWKVCASSNILLGGGRMELEMTVYVSKIIHVSCPLWSKIRYYILVESENITCHRMSCGIFSIFKRMRFFNSNLEAGHVTYTIFFKKYLK